MSFIVDFTIDKIVIPSVAVILIVALVLVVALAPFGIYAMSVCVDNGYPRAYTKIPQMEIRCGRIVNQTEYICLLDDVVAKRCLPNEGGK